MLSLFTAPLALVGLASLPALVAIYYLRNRPRRQVVSSLLLWVDPRETPDSGTQFERLRTPLLFWLEVAALLLLTLAAAGPRLKTTASTRPLVVVLDDSFSMLAGAADSPRERAAAALLEEFRNASRSSVRLVLAGERPQILGEGARHSSEIEPLLKGWTCQSAGSALGPAVSFALELGGDLATVLVLTDHAPDPPPETGRLRWWSFGTARSNWAFVNANRTPGPRGDRVLIEVANLAHSARSTTLRIEATDPVRELQRSEIHVNAFETHRLILEVPGGDNAPSIRAVLDPDDLAFDNSITLLPAVRKSVRYDIAISDPKLRTAFERAVKASGTAVPDERRPQLYFHDREVERPEASDEWDIRLLVEAEAEAYTGPFVLDRAHPLLEGLSLTGLVWGGGKSPLPGAPVVMAGNVPLLTDRESATGKHTLTLRLRQDLSTLTQSPAWPELIWNLLQWRRAHLPGLERSNVRLGHDITWTLPGPAEKIEVTGPAREPATVAIHGRRATIRAERSGVYQLRAGPDNVQVAVNTLSRSESDLTKCASGQWGEEEGMTFAGSEFRDLRWLLILLALAVLTLHTCLQPRHSVAPRTVST